jgi:predicted transcriptional regulator
MTVSKTWRAPDELFEQLREVAFRTRTPANQIITDAVREWLATEDRYEEIYKAWPTSGDTEK